MTKLSREASGLGEGDAANDNEPAGEVEHDDGTVETGTITDRPVDEQPELTE